jgi:(1->4)-alpha-D-glucan 1-alpha-D-glucosylmutase
LLVTPDAPAAPLPDRVPASTYRLQLHPGFTFADACQVIPYLAALGVTDVYCSPLFTARPGSTHGYDVCNHNEISPELGGDSGFAALTAALSAHGLGLILDFVPNHMGIDARTNPWWRDVLENGPSSPFARVFDIDWAPLKPELTDRILLPILGEPYGEALESGRLQLAFDGGALVLCYGDQRLPTNPRRTSAVYEWRIDEIEATLGTDHRDLREFLSILTALRNLPPYTVRDGALVAERQREKEVARERLVRLVDTSPAIREHIERAVASYNGRAGDPSSFDRLHDVLEQQPYRLASWKTASHEINYRRFFDINDLAGLRVEDERVFDHIHRLLLRLVASETVTGLRLDHVDGLWDPAGYLARLQQVVGRARGRPAEGAAAGRFHIVVEKILSAGEALPRNWATSGTTGYTFLNDVNGLFVERRHARQLTRTYRRLTGRTAPVADVVYDSKRLIVGTAMSSEFQVLVSAVNRLSESQRATRDFTLTSIGRALREVVACFPVYRTYISTEGVSRSDRTFVDAALAAAQARNPATEPSIFAFLRTVLLPDPPRSPRASAPARLLYEQRLDVARKFQQYTAPVQAKGVEDTAFYRHNLLLSLNEVGGEPARFGCTVEEFHAANRLRLAAWPHESTATGTHDTKRGEDARARLNVLSEIPAEWREAVSGWMRINRRSRTRIAPSLAPTPDDEYHFYQALLAIWPAEPAGTDLPASAPPMIEERLRAYVIKAAREAKVSTSWINPNTEYEEAIAAFARATLAGPPARAFLAAFVPFARRVAWVGAFNSLAQLILKLASPGVPDFYQGTELWDLTLVDPDNRRPVDYDVRRAWLDELAPVRSRVTGDPVEPSAHDIADLLDTWSDGRIKLYVTSRGLQLRRTRAALFLGGDYLPLECEGRHRERLVALARVLDEDVVVAVTPRLIAPLGRGSGRLLVAPEAWGDTRVRLPQPRRGRRWRHLLTGEELSVVHGATDDWLLASQVFATCPVALLGSGSGLEARGSVGL